MNLAELSIRNHVVTWVFAALLLLLGLWSYLNLPRLEDPEFTLKDALIITPYPGATAAEVAGEVSNVIEMAAQEMEQLKRVVSRSERGRSTVTVTIRDQYGKDELPQVWDELRRRVGDAQRKLPPGAGPSLVIDDFGDVFGIFFALTGPEFSEADLYQTAKMLRRELLLVRDVKKVELFGVQQEVVYVEMQRDRMARLGLRPERVFAALREQNLVVPSGQVDVGPLALPISPTGAWTSTRDFETLLIRGGEDGTLVFLGDIATIRRDLIDPPTTRLRYDGQAAIGIGISAVSGGNVVQLGKAVENRLRELSGHIPLGMELHKISFQADTVTAAIQDFISNLIAAVLIVFVVLLLAMGLRSGLIIGTVLVLTMSGTMILMDLGGIILERISLGALIIALGMLVDNAIVITEGMLIALQRGKDRLQAAKEVVSQTALPLLGSTAIAILAFGAIGLSDDSTGEYTRSLFVVLLFSLGLSWITAVTITPLFGYLFLKVAPQKDSQTVAKDPYASWVYRAYRGLLLFCLRRRGLSIVVMLLLLAASILGFQQVENNFFPESTRPQFMLNVWMPVGTRLAETDRITESMRQEIAALPGVTHVTTSVGQGTLRFLLTYAPERFDTAYAQFLVDVEDHSLIDGLITQSETLLQNSHPEAMVVGRRFLLGPGEGGRIQIRFSGEDQAELRRLAMQAVRILQEDGGAKGIRLDCREELPVLRPQFSEAQARLAGITRTDLGQVLESSFSGRRIGVYREGEDLLPVIVRAPEDERRDPDFIRDGQIFSPAAGAFIPVRQIVNGFATELEDPILMRRNRLPTITVHAEQASGLTSTLRDRIAPAIAAIPLPPGYRMEWGGEFEDSSKAQAALAAALPAFVLLMVLIVLMLFNSLRITLMIWMVVPLALLGIVIGLLVFGHPFGFMALLGALSLAGMLIKNSIVLTDEVLNLQKAGLPAWKAVVDAAVSRVRPVSLAALTTVLGLIPLVPDVFFGAMAVTIVVGLLFATILTLFVVPVLYVTFFGVREEKAPSA